MRRWDDLLVVTGRVRREAPDSAVVFALEAAAFRETRRWEELNRLIQDRLTKHPDDRFAFDEWIKAASRRGRWEEVERIVRKRVSGETARASDYNELAWISLMQGRAGDEAVDAAQRAALFDRDPSPAALHTLAAVYAEVGRYVEARETILTEMEEEGLDEPSRDEWYVFGRIAEGYGEWKAAEAAYRRVLDGEDQRGDDDCRVLARRRLGAMRGPEKKEAANRHQ